MAARVTAMEMHLVRRPVKGGPARIRRKEMAAQRYRAGGPGVLRTPGRRPPHRNGGARRLSGYAAKSRSDAPTGGAQASPFLCFRPPLRRPMQKGWGLALPPYSHERTTMQREVVKKMAAKKATPAGGGAAAGRKKPPDGGRGRKINLPLLVASENPSGSGRYICGKAG